MISLEKVKDVAGNILDTAQAIFKRDQVLYTVFFSVTKTGNATPVCLSMKEQDNMEYISDLIEELASVPETEALITLIEVDFKYLKEGETFSGKVKDSPDAQTSLMVIIHTRDGLSAMRQIIYVKEDDNLMFAGEPWVEDFDNIGGVFGENPFPRGKYSIIKQASKFISQTNIKFLLTFLKKQSILRRPLN